MIEGIGSLNISRLSLQEGDRPPQKTRQGAGQPEAAKRVDAPKNRQGLDLRKVEAMAKELNKALGEIQGDFSVSVDDTTGMVVVRITDATTGEIVKQIPPQQLLDADISMEKIIGILVDDLA